MKLIAYYRVSTEAQGESGLGLAAQRAAVEAHAALRGDEIIAHVEEIASGGKADRVLLTAALECLKAGEADGLIVAKLDRLARSIAQVDRVLTAANKYGWSLVALDLGVDTSSASGRMVANVLAAVAQWERETIGERTSAALQAKKVRNGGKLKGSRPCVEPSILLWMQKRRREGWSYRLIAERATDVGLKTSQGGKWRPGTVKHILDNV